MKKDFKLNLTTNLTESTVDPESRTIRNVAILSQLSRDSKNNIRRRYTDSALNSAVNVLEGAGACVGHLEKGKIKGRKLTEYYGVYKNLKVEKDFSGASKVTGNLEIFDCKEGAQILDIAIKAPHLGGNSIHAGGRGYMDNGVEVIEELLPLTTYGHKPSVDVVTNPATTLNLFEDNNSDINNNNHKKGKRKMKEIDIMEATLDNIKMYRPDVMAQLEKDFDKSAEIKELTESNETLVKENKELIDKIDVFEAQAALSEKVEMRDKLILAANLPAEIITDTFKQSLMNVTESKDDKGVIISIEDGIKALINDRASMTRGVKNMGGSHDVFESQEKGGTNQSTTDIKPRDIVSIFKRK